MRLSVFLFHSVWLILQLTLYSEHIVEGYYTNSQCTLIVVTPGMVGLKIELKICMPSIRLRLSSTVNYSDKTLALNMLTD